MCVPTENTYRVPGFLSSRPNWVPPPPHPLGSVAPLPFWVQGINTLSCGGWRDPIPTKEQTLCYSMCTIICRLSVCTLLERLLLQTTKMSFFEIEMLQLKLFLQIFNGERREDHDLYVVGFRSDSTPKLSAYTDIMAFSRCCYITVDSTTPAP
jgi:hypothetical protein